ncbi:MAG: hypothetical protein Kow0069_26240 [Promethearchaeota archaeon]
MTEFDVVVVGAGPAGSVAAAGCARAGLSTVLLERGSRPGAKNASGTALSPKVWRDFPELAARIPAELPARVSRLARLHFVDAAGRETSSVSYSPSKKYADYPAARRFLTFNVYRGDLDPWLANVAVEAGATLRCGELVEELLRDSTGSVRGVKTRSGQEYEAPLVLGADGVCSTVAAAAGARTRWGRREFALMVTLDFAADPAALDLVAGEEAVHYYLSPAFPVAYAFHFHDGVHVGLGHHVEEFARTGTSPAEYLRRLLACEPVKAALLLAGAEPREYQAHGLTFLARPSGTHAQGVLLLGDAAGFPCPLEAEGIYYAMLSGRLAAGVCAEAVGARDFSANFLSRYEVAWKSSPIGEEFAAGDYWKKFIDALPFNLDSARWLVELVPDVGYSALNAAEAHDASRQALFSRLAEVFSLAYGSNEPVLYPLVRPLLEEYSKAFLKRLPGAGLFGTLAASLLEPAFKAALQHLVRLGKEVGDRRRARSGLGEDEWPVEIPGVAAPVLPPLPSEPFDASTLRRLVPTSKPGADFLRVDRTKCTGCGACAVVCPVGLWSTPGSPARAEPDGRYPAWCLECGGCSQACPVGAISLKFPGGGLGVEYERG